MRIRTYQPGDEQAQSEVYNQATRTLPGYKPATAEDIARRYRTPDADPSTRFYAVEDGQRGKVVGYITFNPNGRISYPWCLPEALAARQPLLDAALTAMKERGMKRAWAAYRADWVEPLAFLQERGFRQAREWINYVTPLDRLLRDAQTGATQSLDGQDVRWLVETHPRLFKETAADRLVAFFSRNEYFDPEAGYVLKDRGGKILGVGMAIANPRFADPTKIDPAMPCFRLGAFGTESERHKRVNGLFSCVFQEEAAAEALLGEAVRRFAALDLGHVAAQAPSDQPALVAFYDRHFQRQGAFPVLERQLG